MKRSVTLLAGLLSTSFATELPLWKAGTMPGKAAAENREVRLEKGNDLHVTAVAVPTLTFFSAQESDEPRPVVIVCPGGGYRILSYEKEGTEIAQWLNSIGVSAALLKYRVPGNRAGALEDARRAVRLVREHSKDWNIDPERVGMLGFSAGGHLAASCSNSPDRPNFTVLVYPAYLFGRGGGLVDEIKIDSKSPPAFVVQAQDDRRYYRSSLAYATALDARGIPVELHLFAKGGHGFGLRSEHPVSQWPKLCEAWMREMDFLR